MAVLLCYSQLCCHAGSTTYLVTACNNRCMHKLCPIQWAYNKQLRAMQPRHQPSLGELHMLSLLGQLPVGKHPPTPLFCPPSLSSTELLPSHRLHSAQDLAISSMSTSRCGHHTRLLARLFIPGCSLCSSSRTMPLQLFGADYPNAPQQGSLLPLLTLWLAYSKAIGYSKQCTAAWATWKF